MVETSTDKRAARKLAHLASLHHQPLQKHEPLCNTPRGASTQGFDFSVRAGGGLAQEAGTVFLEGAARFRKNEKLCYQLLWFDDLGFTHDRRVAAQRGFAGDDDLAAYPCAAEHSGFVPYLCRSGHDGVIV